MSLEPRANPSFPARMEGIAPVKGKNEWWEKNHRMHSAEVRGPWTHGDRFIVCFK